MPLYLKDVSLVSMEGIKSPPVRVYSNITNVPSKFFSVCAEENGVWAAHFDVWALQLSHFLKRQIKSIMSGGDSEGSAGSAVRFGPPIFGWNRCVWQPKNIECLLNKMFLHLATFPEFLLSSVYT